MAPVKTHVPCKVSKWYKADDVKTHFRRKRAAVPRTTLKKNLVPG